MQSSGSLTNVNRLSVDNKADDKMAGTKQLTYYDVRHPTTKKIIDRNLGRISTITDMGAVYKTTILKPEKMGSYSDVEHRLDEEFKESDKVMHQKESALRNRNYSPIAILNKQTDSNRGAVFDRMDKQGKLTRHYNYDTTIDIASENEHSIQRIHTNKKEGVKVNTEPYKYGKTLIAKSTDMSPRRDDHIQYVTSQSSSSSSSQANNQFCCLVPPCLYLPPCIQTQSQPKFNQAFLSFLQTRNHFMNQHQTKLLLSNSISHSKKYTKHSANHKYKINISQQSQQQFRRRSRFPDPQWNCAYKNIKEQIDYMCNNEIPTSFLKYCKPIYAQFNVLVESILYLDSILNTCKNINLCPLTY